MPLADGLVAADRIVLVGDPNDQDDVEGGGGVVEELGHYRLHSCAQRNEYMFTEININETNMAHGHGWGVGRSRD